MTPEKIVIKTTIRVTTKLHQDIKYLLDLKIFNSFANMIVFGLENICQEYNTTNINLFFKLATKEIESFIQKNHQYLANIQSRFSILGRE